MYISNVVIKNFRAIEDIQVDLREYINVIVGPNGVGKTNILQAIRLVKALLAPRTSNEAQQTMMSLGAASPHFPQRLLLGALARDANRAIEIRTTYLLTEEEIADVVSGQDIIAANIVQTRVGQGFSNPVMLIQYINSPEGKRALEETKNPLSQFIERLKSSRTLIAGLEIFVTQGMINSLDQFSGPILGFLDLKLPMHKSIFSYFPADRALPFGDVNLQVGAPELQQQLEAHNSQPQLKYLRLKNFILSSIMLGDEERESFKSEFQTIFDGILKGRTIQGVSVNEIGLLSVVTRNTETGKLIEIDNLSSGEKNLALTFLLIAKSVARGGVVLFDEPELHLNPAVCRDVLNFMLKQYSKPNNIQFIICTHSPEILSGAFASEDCVLLHVKSGNLVNRVGKTSVEEYADALSKLGTSVSETLLYEGTLFVEGVDDKTLLEAAFPELFRRIQIVDRGGRREVERHAAKLQQLEEKGEKVSPAFILIDRDEELTNIKSTEAVRILQWDRRCIENYLIDLDVLAELLRSDIATTPIKDEGEVERKLRNLAMGQLQGQVVKEIYNHNGFESTWLRTKDLDFADVSDVATSIYGRLEAARRSLQIEAEDVWKDNFVACVNARLKELTPLWEAKWKELCDGKQLFADIQSEGWIKVSVSVFKRRTIVLMKDTRSENWRIMKSLLDGLFN